VMCGQDGRRELAKHLLRCARDLLHENACASTRGLGRHFIFCDCVFSLPLRGA
jgi:hypothetical protein